MNHFQIGLATLSLIAATTVSAADNAKQATFDVQFRVLASCQIEQFEARVEAQCTGVRPQVTETNQDVEEKASPRFTAARQVLIYF